MEMAATHTAMPMLLASLLLFHASCSFAMRAVPTTTVRHQATLHGHNAHSTRDLEDRSRTEDGAAAGIQVAARQRLFDYATQQGLSLLSSMVQEVAIPDATKSFSLPIIGDFTLQISNIKIVEFNASTQDAKLAILDGNFKLWVSEVGVHLNFNWHWEKLGITGTGDGELFLRGGNIDYDFSIVTSPETNKPQINVNAASSNFGAVELKIHSYSSDWLYQAVLSLFNDQIQKAVQNGINSALQQDVPGGINKILDTLPTHLEIRGLPFSTAFDYTVFTLAYVLVKGYGEIEADQPTASMVAHKTLAQLPRLADMVRCPFEVSPLPLDFQKIGEDTHMVSIYLHESIINCMLWGLHRSNAMQYSIVDGTVPKLHLTTDLLAMLIPALPKTYPHQMLRIDAAALSAPHVSFSTEKGASVEASYRTTIYVANETLGNPKIVTLSASLNITAKVNWDSTIITSVSAHHVVEEAAMDVSAQQWDKTVAWFVQNYAGLFPLSQVVGKLVHTPVISQVSLVNAQSTTYDQWFQLSGDVQVHNLQPQPRQQPQ